MRWASERSWEPVHLTVMYTLAMEFLVFVFIAILISVPLGWYIVDKLLHQFAYRIDINPLRICRYFSRSNSDSYPYCQLPGIQSYRNQSGRSIEN